MRTILIRVALPIACLILLPATPARSQDLAPLVRRIAATVRLAAQEYSLGFEGGRVVATAEIEEAELFLGEAERMVAGLGDSSGASVVLRSAIQEARVLVGRLAAPDSVHTAVERLVQDLGNRFAVDVEPIPVVAPSLAEGEAVYRAMCMGCHGVTGGGDGPDAVGLDPAPTDLTDRVGLSGASPLDFFRRVTIGVAGTAMPPFESVLTPEQRWAVARYTSTLRLPLVADADPVPQVGPFGTTARMSDRQLLAMLGPGADLDLVAAVRRGGAEASDPARLARTVFASVRRQLDSADEAAARGDSEAARRMAFDAYMTFEQVERRIQVEDRGLAGSIELAFATFRDRAGSGASTADLRDSRRALDEVLARGEALFTDALSGVNLFLQSLILLIREGLEAILVIGALVAFLVKTGAPERRRDIHRGVGTAILASLLTAGALETVFRLTPAHQEVLEGITMAAAALMLFYVSYWLLSRIEVARWNRFVRSKVQDALGSGSTLALTAVAFLAVYREGFETVLFYKALVLTAGPGGWMPILLGVLLGSVALIVVYVLINRYGVRLPLKPFFAVTSAFLYYMGFVFAGKAVAELQAGRVLSTTMLEWAPRAPALGVYPTLETLIAQGLFVLLAAVAVVWVFGVRGRSLAPPAGESS